MAGPLVRVWQEGLERGTVLDAESAVSTILGMLRRLRIEGGTEPWQALVRMLPAELAGIPEPDARGLLAALALLAPDDQLARTCTDALAGAPARSLVPEGFAAARFVRANGTGDPFGDQSIIVAEFQHADETPHALVLLFDNNLSGVAGIVKDAWLAPDPADVLAQWDEAQDDNEVPMRRHDVDRDTFAEQLTRGLERFERFDDPPCDDDVETMHALLHARLRDLGAAPADDEDDALVPDEREIQAAVTAFLDSPHAAHLDRDTADDVVSQMLDYKTAYTDGILHRWSPIALELCLLDWFPRMALLDSEAAAIEQVPDIAAAWARHAGEQRGLTADLIDTTVEFIEQVIEPRFATAMTEHGAAGPAKSLLRGLVASGIDPSDQVAVGAWVEDLNARSIAERSDMLGMPAPAARLGSAPATPDARTPRSARDILQLKVTLTGVKPPVWRRILVPQVTTFERLHQVLQAAFGWTDSHLHEFEIDGHRIGMSDLDELEEPPADERRYALASYAREGFRMRYLYDFGDYWLHDVRVEKILDRDPGMTYPALVGGRRACPPEDCGGPGGYAHMLEALDDPSHEEHESYLEWVGGSWDAADARLDQFAARLAE